MVVEIFEVIVRGFSWLWVVLGRSFFYYLRFFSINFYQH